MNSQHSKYLANCKGVFQGGGCKAIAYVGAYKEALSQGIGFSEFAGTSAGSIIAAFLAAGATPAQLDEIVSSISELTSQFNQPRRKCWKRKLLQLVLYLIHIIFKSIPKQELLFRALIIIERYGIYDSTPIRTFVNQKLCDILHKEGKVTFSDLPFPLTVVASDLHNHSIKKWSLRETPHHDVSHAVQCSCAVPFVFMPVERTYVDGGMLSNLPALFVESEAYIDKTLAFSLKPDQSLVKKEDKILTYIRSLVATIVEGSTNIQTSLMPEIYHIPISSPLGLLDFAKLRKGSKEMQTAIKQGEDAVKSFIKRREYRQDPSQRMQQSTKTHLKKVEQIRTFVSHSSFGKNDIVVVSLRDLSWCWDMFLTILTWKNDQSQIEIYIENGLLPDTHQREKEESRIRMLCHMGIPVHLSSKKLPVYGYFFFKKPSWKGISVVYDDKANRKGKILNDGFDHFIIQNLISKLRQSEYEFLPALPVNTLSLESVDENVILDRLRDIKAYVGCDLHFEDVPLSQVRFMTKNVLGYKYRSMDVLIQAYGSDTVLYGPAAFRFARNKLSLIGPPVVEYWDNHYVIINGNTRFLYAYRNHKESLRAVVVRNVTTPLISDDRFRPNQVVVTDKTVRGSERYNSSWDYALFRPIEFSIRPYRQYLKD